MTETRDCPILRALLAQLRTHLLAVEPRSVGLLLAPPAADPEGLALEAAHQQESDRGRHVLDRGHHRRGHVARERRRPWRVRGGCHAVLRRPLNILPKGGESSDRWQVLRACSRGVLALRTSSSARSRSLAPRPPASPLQRVFCVRGGRRSEGRSGPCILVHGQPLLLWPSWCFSGLLKGLVSCKSGRRSD